MKLSIAVVCTLVVTFIAGPAMVDAKPRRIRRAVEPSARNKSPPGFSFPATGLPNAGSPPQNSPTPRSELPDTASVPSFSPPTPSAPTFTLPKAVSFQRALDFQRALNFQRLLSFHMAKSLKRQNFSFPKNNESLGNPESITKN
ncbi:hypothetical protein BDF19DRAFT_447136 [Syncephalis fuscata]|nr:hypothetical protein BDF19DRAFT_447136 [Syncephalis fuscata]